jgi:hypothetical protein
MIYDALLSLDLCTELGPPLPTSALTGLENLLFTGHWSTRRASCPLSGAAFLARCHRVLSAMGCAALEVQDDAGCVLRQTVPAAPGATCPSPWPEDLPPAWTDQPCELQLRGRLHNKGIVAAITLRYTPRHDPEHGALTGALRALWDVKPSSGDEAAFQRSFEAALADGHSLGELGRRLRDRGRQLTDQLMAKLEDAFDAVPGSSHGRLLALHGYRERPERFGDLLAGLPEAQRLTIALMEAHLARSDTRWAAIDAAGVHGHLRHGEFVPSAEVAHVA